MYRKDWYERSPLRVFEKSIRGGLGKGNLGVVMSRAGVGKTAFLIGVALDDLLRKQKAIHVSFEDPVERLREFYEAIFLELRRSIHLADPVEARLNMERHRMIHSYRSRELSVAKLRANLAFLKDHGQFVPQVVILDGVNFLNTDNQELADLKQFAVDHQVEVWMSAQTHRELPRDERRIAKEIVRFEDYISVVVLLHPAHKGAVTIEILKDHDNPNVADLKMELDPTSLLVKLPD